LVGWNRYFFNCNGIYRGSELRHQFELRYNPEKKVVWWRLCIDRICIEDEDSDVFHAFAVIGTKIANKSCDRRLARSHVWPSRSFKHSKEKRSNAGSDIQQPYSRDYLLRQVDGRAVFNDFNEYQDWTDQTAIHLDSINEFSKA
jgi:hypothetical protein